MTIRSLLRSDYALATAVLVAAWFILSSPWLFGTVTIPYDAKAHFQAQIQFLIGGTAAGCFLAAGLGIWLELRRRRRAGGREPPPPPVV